MSTCKSTMIQYQEVYLKTCTSNYIGTPHSIIHLKFKKINWFIFTINSFQIFFIYSYVSYLLLRKVSVYVCI